LRNQSSTFATPLRSEAVAVTSKDPTVVFAGRGFTKERGGVVSMIMTLWGAPLAVNVSS